VVVVELLMGVLEVLVVVEVCQEVADLGGEVHSASMLLELEQVVFLFLL
jgi:hypothetical protein